MSDKTKTKTRKQSRKAYTDQFKRDAVKLLSQPGYTLGKASEALGVSQASLASWKKTLLPREQAGLALENAQLLKRVKELEMERDILKKAATYFAKESK